MTTEPSNHFLVVHDFGSDVPGATKVIIGPMAIALQNMRREAELWRIEVSSLPLTVNATGLGDRLLGCQTAAFSAMAYCHMSLDWRSEAIADAIGGNCISYVGDNLCLCLLVQDGNRSCDRGC